MSTLAEVMAPVRHVLLDFDGPVCSVFGGLPAPVVARRLAEAIDEDMPDDVVGTDPLALLSVFADRDRDTLVAAEVKLRELEVEAVLTAPITPGVVEALEAFRDTGRTVTIVSNNSAAAVRRFLDDHQLDGFVTDVCSRERPEPGLLKPNSYLLDRARARHGVEPGLCLMIGDSETDVVAARRFGAKVAFLANKPEKLQSLLAGGRAPDVVLADMASLTPPPEGERSMTHAVRRSTEA